MPMFDDTIWGARQWLRLTLEDPADPGVFDTDALTANVTWIRLAEDDAFSMQANPEKYMIKSADSLAETVQVGYNSIMVPGSLKTPFYPSQANLLLKWATTLIASSAPATYRPNSVTLDYFDGKEVQRFLGCLVNELSINVPATGPAMLGFGLVAWKRDAASPTLTEPSAGSFPTELPYTLQNTSGALKSGGSTARTNYASFAASFKNAIQTLKNESVNPNLIYAGRAISYTWNPRDRVSSTDRASWRNNSNLANNEVTFTVSGQNATKLNFNGKGNITEYRESRPMGDAAMVNMTVEAMYDAGASPTGSFSYTITAP